MNPQSRRFLLVFVGVAVLAVAALFVLDHYRESSRPRGVLLITAAPLRADDLSSAPGLVRLAAEGVLFARTTASSPSTEAAMASIATGAFAPAAEAADLVAVLTAGGVRSAAFGGAPGGAVDAERTVDEALEWIAADREARFFAWVHLDAAKGGSGVAALDASIERLLGDLAAGGRLERTLVIVGGARGEMRGEHGEPPGYGIFVYEPAIHVPLVLRGPGIKGAKVVERAARTVDIAPTVLARLDVAVPTSMQGADLSALLERGAEKADERLAYAESLRPSTGYGWSPLRTLRAGSWKLIRAPRSELYDLASDPGELENLAAREPERLAEMEGRLDAFLAAHGIGAEAAASDLDPKDKIHLLGAFEEARASLSRGGDAAAALTALDALIEEEPRLVEAQILRGEALHRLGRLAEASAAYARAVDLEPTRDDVRARLLVLTAELEIEGGDLAAAEQAAVGALELAPTHLGGVEPGAHLVLGRIYEARDDLDRAAAAWQAEIEVDAASFGAHFRLGRLLVRGDRAAEARPLLERAAHLDPASGEARLYLAKAYLDLEQLPQAEAASRRALELGVPSRIEPFAHFILAEVYGKQGRLEEALREEALGARLQAKR